MFSVVQNIWNNTFGLIFFNKKICPIIKMVFIHIYDIYVIYFYFYKIYMFNISAINLDI